MFALDGLTLLWVRRSYQVVYHFFIKTIPRQIIMIDIDNFGDFNNNYGHDFGDRVLRAVGHVILKESRLRGFRYGGEEFAILLPWASIEKALVLAERIKQRIGEIEVKDLINPKNPIDIDDNFRITVSCGIGRHEEEADENLYAAKKNGKNCVKSISRLE